MVFTGEVFTASDGSEFKLIKEPSCRYCHSPLDPAENFWRCCTCHRVDMEWGIEYAFDQTRAAGVYSKKHKNAISSLILRNKRDPGSASILAEVMAHVIRTQYPHLGRVDTVTEVPISASKLRDKGFNHAQAIAEALANCLDLSYTPEMLVQIRDPEKSQHESDLRERLTNLHGCFEIGRIPSGVGSVLVVDDTYVTGGTVNECAAVLKAHGIQRVFIMCAARGVMVSDRSRYLEEYFDG